MVRWAGCVLLVGGGWCDNGRVELRQLEYFVVVAETLHFGRAAELLHIGQPAVSQQIGRLERELGVTLFDRSPRTVRLSEAGQRLLPRARAVLVAVEGVRAVAVATAGGRVPFRLGTSSGLGARLERVLAELGIVAPHLDVELVGASTRVRLDRVRSGGLDAAFVRGLRSARELQVVQVWEDSLVAAVPISHELAGLAEIPLGRLAGLPLRLVSRRENEPLVDLVTNACAGVGFEPQRAGTTSSLQDNLAAIGAGAPTWTVVYAAQASQLRSSRVAFVPIGSPSLAMPTALAFAARSESTEAVLRACRLVASD
jgi:DNA-binding transcriptional LysR family regulator